MKVLFTFLMFFTIEAKDLGVFGETFEIKEKDLLEYIQTRLLQMQQDGSLEAESNRIREKILNNVKTPQAVANIKHTEVERTFKYDPTIEITQDIADHKGQVFARKGDRFNPLEIVSLSKPLLFIDGDDEKQVQWAVLKIAENNLSKIILVKGSPFEIQKKLNRDIYFDQHGFITSKLGIQHVPAIVYQNEGVIEDHASEKVLTIREEKTAAVEESEHK